MECEIVEEAVCRLYLIKQHASIIFEVLKSVYSKLRVGNSTTQKLILQEIKKDFFGKTGPTFL